MRAVRRRPRRARTGRRAPPLRTARRVRLTWTYGIAGLATVVLLAAGGLLTDIGPWYRALRKPSWQPPDWLFGPAWTLILGMAAYAGVLAWEAAGAAGLSRTPILIAFGLNWVLHLLWSPLFFKLHRPDWSLIEIPFLWASILAMMVVTARLSPLAPWLLAPYLAWVTFATGLNIAIVRLNGPFAP